MWLSRCLVCRKDQCSVADVFRGRGPDARPWHPLTSATLFLLLSRFRLIYPRPSPNPGHVHSHTPGPLAFALSLVRLDAGQPGSKTGAESKGLKGSGEEGAREEEREGIACGAVLISLFTESSLEAVEASASFTVVDPTQSRCSANMLNGWETRSRTLGFPENPLTDRFHASDLHSQSHFKYS